MERKIGFSLIDAKEYPVIYIKVVDENGRLMIERHGRTAEEETLRLDMEFEYLSGIAELQEELHRKYRPLFDGIDVSKKDIDVSKKDIREVLQDAKNRWYHAHLDEWRKMDGLYYT